MWLQHLPQAKGALMSCTHNYSYSRLDGCQAGKKGWLWIGPASKADRVLLTASLQCVRFQMASVGLFSWLQWDWSAVIPHQPRAVAFAAMPEAGSEVGMPLAELLPAFYSHRMTLWNKKTERGSSIDHSLWDPHCLIHVLFHPFTHSFIHSFTHSLVVVSCTVNVALSQV